MTSSIITSDNGVLSGTSGLKNAAGNDGTLQLQTTNSSGTAVTALTIDNNQNPTFANAINTPNTFGFKNRFINGAMGIAQRGTSFSAPATGSYTLDRWVVFWGGAAPATVAQVSGPSGFRNAAQITGAASNTSTVFQQRIESYNCSDLSGATITIQANIAVSSAQTVQWLIGYAGSQDNYTSAPTITSGTWSATSTATTFTATITGLPSGVTNGIYLNISPNNNGAFTSGTITITGVQLEKGSTATSFDYRPYGTELALCQRYYEYAGLTVPTDVSCFWSGNVTNGATYYVPCKYAVTKRNAGTVTLLGSQSSLNFSTITVTSSGEVGMRVSASATATGTGYFGTSWSASAEI